jgi:hypothetical protein
MAAHEGINWDQFSNSLEIHEPYLGTDEAGAQEQWSLGRGKWPTPYIKAVQPRYEEAYQALQYHLKNEVNLPDQVQITHRGDVPKNAKVKSGSIFPNWSGNNPDSEYGIHHYGQSSRLHIHLVPREHIIGVGHEGEGEVFFDEGAKKPKKKK